MFEENAIKKIRNFIMKRSGLYFKGCDMLSLTNNIAQRMRAVKCPSYEEYYKLLAESAEAREEFTELLNLLTIKHTQFFRNPEQFTALKNKILPRIMENKAKRGDRTLNILSAGCSTGEEPYSIAMVLLDLIGHSAAWKIGILSIDISTKALVVAKKGFYNLRALQCIRQDFIKEYIQKYCFIHKDKVFVSPVIKNMVEFQYMNLIDEFYPQGFDIIFCRNVTIYFEAEMIKSVIEKFYRSLNAEGCLFSGGTETLYGISDRFELVDAGNALIYEKIPVKERQKAQSAERREQRQEPKVEQPETIYQMPAAAPAKTLKDAHGLYEKAKEDFIRKDYEAAEKSAKSALEIEPAFQEARILLANIFVNRERFQEAQEECRRAININFLSAESRYLLGLIHKKKGEFKDALDNLRKAVYLDSNYTLAYFVLADTYREKGLIDEALKAYRNTLKALEQESEEHFRESLGGLAREALAQVCFRNIKEITNAESG